MKQAERRIFLIKELIAEQPGYSNISIPDNKEEQKNLLRALMNVRSPGSIGADFLKIQDEYLREEIKEKGITDMASLIPEEDGIYLWQGDITTLKCDAIVNAANSGMTGCYAPCHACIDNCIHTYAGVQLRLSCADIIKKQGHKEYTGSAKITPAYNLPCRYVIHTVGPIIYDKVTEKDCGLLALCYRSCMEIARKNGVGSIAFCCISTGEFHFPNDLAAQIAVRTVREHKGDIKVIFNVFKDADYKIYRELLG